MSRLKALGCWSEFWIVLTAAAIWVLAGEAMGLIAVAPANAAAAFREATYLALALAGTFAFLGLRGWTMPDLGFKPSWAGVMDGGVIAFCTLAAAATLKFAVAHTFFDVGIGDEPGTIGAPMAVVLLVLARPMFEELLVTGYPMAKIGPRFGQLFAINVSVGLRVACHLHEGPTGLLLALPMALAFAYWYAGTRRLFPLVVAHGLIDFVLLMPQP